MKVIFGDRTLLYKIMHMYFQVHSIAPTIAELGVLEGKNAVVMNEIFHPERLYLIDSWSKDATEHYMRINQHRHWINTPNDYAFYYGGDVTAQETYDRLYEKTKTAFTGADHVEIIRAGTIEARDALRDRLAGQKLDLIYVDASHDYESVLDDLMIYQDLLAEDGVFQLNDCCYSEQGAKQNLGVLEAVTRFVKMTDFVPAIITNTDFSDLLLVKSRGRIAVALDHILDNSDVAFVEVPDQLLGALRVRNGKNISLV